MARRVVVLVDGEHHPDAVRAAVATLRDRGDEPVLACYVGGSEKVAVRGTPPDVGVPAVWPDQPLDALAGLVGGQQAEAVIDLTADPVVDDRRRARFVAVTLMAGAAYEAAGVRWTPPPRPHLTARPAVAITATGKRAGKTAVSAALARHAAAAGRRPVVVAMGRGGPADPVVVAARQRLTVAHLLEVARNGGHAASDFYEDAVMTGLPTVGCRRVGEGPAGEVAYSNVAAGVAAAERLDADLVVLEGSGAALPPVHADVTVLVVPATIDPVALHAMLPVRFLLADLVVISLADPASVPAERTLATVAAVDQILGGLPPASGGSDRAHRPALGLAVTRFRLHPMQAVAGQRVLLATTAPPAAAGRLAADVAALGGQVVGVTHDLADRVALRAALAAAPAHDVLLTELKAAAVDVAAAVATERGAATVFYDNRPETVDLPLPDGSTRISSLDAAFDEVVDLAATRAAQRAPAAHRSEGA